MRWRGRASVLLLLAGAVAGTLSDISVTLAPQLEDGYYILSTDFHVHVFPGDGALAPWDLRRDTERGVLEAVRQGRTVAYDGDRHPYGDPTLGRLVAGHRERASRVPSDA